MHRSYSNNTISLNYNWSCHLHSQTTPKHDPLSRSLYMYNTRSSFFKCNLAVNLQGWDVVIADFIHSTCLEMQEEYLSMNDNQHMYTLPSNQWSNQWSTAIHVVLLNHFFIRNSCWIVHSISLIVVQNIIWILVNRKK